MAAFSVTTFEKSAKEAMPAIFYPDRVEVGLMPASYSWLWYPPGFKDHDGLGLIGTGGIAVTFLLALSRILSMSWSVFSRKPTLSLPTNFIVGDFGSLHPASINVAVKVVFGLTKVSMLARMIPWGSFLATWASFFATRN